MLHIMALRQVQSTVLIFRYKGVQVDGLNYL